MTVNHELRFELRLHRVKNAGRCISTPDPSKRSQGTTVSAGRLRGASGGRNIRIHSKALELGNCQVRKHYINGACQTQRGSVRDTRLLEEGGRLYVGYK